MGWNPEAIVFAAMINFGYRIVSLSSGVKIHMLRRNLRNTRVSVSEQAYIYIQ